MEFARVEGADALTQSRYAIYEGLIALAWADHELHEDEKATLHGLIETNRYMTDEQRDRLHKAVDRRIEITEVWPRLTDVQDRARLIDMANIIFSSDGEFCELEQGAKKTIVSRHLRTLDMAAIQADFETLSAEQAVARERHAEEMKAYRRKYSLMGAVERLFQRRRADASPRIEPTPPPPGRVGGSRSHPLYSAGPQGA